jgi:hypothetical protein
MYCRVEIGPQFLNGQRVNAKDPADGKASLVKCFTLYGSPHSIPTYKMALMMRRIRRSVPLSELPDADAQDVGVFSFPPGARF